MHSEDLADHDLSSSYLSKRLEECMSEDERGDMNNLISFEEKHRMSVPLDSSISAGLKPLCGAVPAWCCSPHWVVTRDGRLTNRQGAGAVWPISQQERSTRPGQYCRGAETPREWTRLVGGASVCMPPRDHFRYLFVYTLHTMSTLLSSSFHYSQMHISRIVHQAYLIRRRTRTVAPSSNA